MTWPSSRRAKEEADVADYPAGELYNSAIFKRGGKEVETTPNSPLVVAATLL
jgi:hypothetical protein